MKRNRKDQIKREAIRLFLENGFKATTMEQIAERVGLSKGSLYHHIKSKNDLLFTAHVQAIAAVNLALAQIVESDLDPEEKLRQAIENHLTKQHEYLDEYRLYLQERKFLPEVFEKSYSGMRRENEKLFERIMEEGIEAGRFDPDLPLRLTLLNLFGMLNWITQWSKPYAGFTIEEITGSIHHLVMTGIGLDKPVPEKKG